MIPPSPASVSRVFKAALAVALAWCLAATAGPSPACTLWSATGGAAGGGSLLAKNRDYTPESTDRFVLRRPEHGLAYLGCLALVSGREVVVAGVNEAGLAVASASASSLPRGERKVPSTVKSLLVRLLTSVRSVDEALSHADWFAGHAPVMYMLADGRESAWVEVGPGGQVAVGRTAQGALAHTNHYLSPELAPQNAKPAQSSRARLARITDLLAGQETFDLKDFERFGQDRSEGPDNSLFRTGSTERSARTMARFLVRTTPGGPAEAVVAGYDRPDVPWSARFILDEAFWRRAAPGETLQLAP